MSDYQKSGAKSEYERALGERLRAARERRRLSLREVEEKSGGRWTAATVGTYERAERSVTVAKLAALAEFYGVPVSSLLPGDAAAAGRPEADALAAVARIADAFGLTVDDLLRGSA